MALAPHSNFLANHETIKYYVGSKLPGHKRFSWGWEDYFGSIVVAKICSSRRIPRYFRKSPRICCGLDSRGLQLFSHGKHNLSPAHSINQNVPKGNSGCKFPKDVALMVWEKWGQFAKTAIVAIFILSVASKADAVDALKTCTCLLKECRLELAKCISNPACAANVACLQTCNNRPDETECQIKCGDLFENSVVDEFNECAVSRKKCVPRKSDVGDFPVPDPSVLVQKFDMKDFSGNANLISLFSFSLFVINLLKAQIFRLFLGLVEIEKKRESLTKMEAVLQTKGLLSLPSKPKTRAFYPLPQGGLRHRFNSVNSLKPKPLEGLSLSSDGFQKFQGFAKKPQLIGQKNRFFPVCKAEVAAAADGVPLLGENESPKFMGIELVTLKKIIPLGLMFFCILFNYTILRDTKDVLVVTAKGSSAEIIPFLKTWVNLPMAVGFMLLYTKLANVLSKQALFYTVILPFIAFFGAFGFVLYPLSNYFHPTALADQLLNILGPRFLGPIAILRIWSFCLFYVMAELWGSVVVSVLFWGFANQITTVDEAKRFYPLFGLGANVALIFSGRTVKYFSNLRKSLGPGVDGWAVSLKAMMSIVVLMGLAICGIYWWVNHNVALPNRSKKKKEKPNMTTMESLKFLVSSKYIRDLATLVVAYGISINLVEVTWKSKLKAQFPSPNEYSSFMGDFSTATGIATFTMMLLSQWIFDKYGWGTAAKITPTVLLLTGVGFFSLILFGDPLAPALAKFGITPLLAAVYVGAMQNIFSKSAKYSLFDPCKEMAYIPLDEDTKVKGKAAIDVVCNPLGKSGGALIQQFMILTFGSLANSTPYLGGVLLVIVLGWLGAARSLDGQFTALRREEELEKEMERVAVKIPVVSQDESGNGSLTSDSSSLNPMGGDSAGASPEPSSPRNV